MAVFNLLTGFSDFMNENKPLVIILAVILMLILALAIVMVVLHIKDKKQVAEEKLAKEAALLAEMQPQSAPEAPAEDEEETGEAEENAAESGAAETADENDPTAEQEDDEMKKKANAPAKKPEPKKAPVVVKAEPPKEEPKKEDPKVSGAGGKWVIEEDKNGKFWFSLIASNGQIMLESPTPYVSLQNAKDGIATYQNNIAADRLEITEHKNGDFQVQVLNGSKRLLATSSTYPSRTQAESTRDSIKRWAQTSVIEVKNFEE